MNQLRRRKGLEQSVDFGHGIMQFRFLNLKLVILCLYQIGLRDTM